MRYYCTLCDYAYLPRALVLYESLVKHSSEDFRLFILCMDDQANDVLLHGLNFDYVMTIAIGYLEDTKELGSIRQLRTWQEFCWTCASQVMELVLPQYDELTYLDADMMFFSDPKQVFDEIGDRSIGIIPHRFIPEKQYLAVNGQFNVSWVSFKNTPVGRECLSAWARQVREKCSATDGCGDQKYLDEWPAKYGDEVCIIQNPGAGLAPWNLARYDFVQNDNGLRIYQDRQTGLNYHCPVVFYHYHEFQDGVRLTYYVLRPEDHELIYRPYLEAYKRAKETIARLSVQA